MIYKYEGTECFKCKKKLGKVAYSVDSGMCWYSINMDNTDKKLKSVTQHPIFICPGCYKKEKKEGVIK
jgi:ferredoxin-like protein FixX